MNKTVKIAEKLDVPSDVFRNVSRFEVVHNDTIYIENHNGITHFSDTEIHIDCKKYTLKIFGEALEIKSLSSKFASVFGLIFNIEFGEFK